tara:strand:+ start:39375 stop:40268 length:894 start_codon:yes stop_codon:yes gene_type:complete
MSALYIANEYWVAVFQLTTAMFGMGATLTARDFRDVVAEPWAVSVGTAVQLVVIPLTTLFFIQAWNLAGGLAVGLALIAAIPGGTVSNIFTFLARGNSAMSICITAVTTLACLATTPIILGLLASSYLPADFVMPKARIFSEIALTLLLPLLLGMAFLYLYPRSAPVVSRWAIRASLFGILLIVLGSLSAGRIDFKAFGLQSVLLVVLFAAVLAIVGALVPRLLRINRADAVAIEMEVVVRNMNLGVLIKASLFPAAATELAALGDTVLFTLLLFGGLQLAIGGLLIWRSGRHQAQR